MKTSDRHHAKRGFTVVELLIVIIIIGILSGTMMLVSMTASQKAEAARISGEIRSMKAAALFYFNDEDKWPNWSNTDGNPEDYLEGKPVFAKYWLGVKEDTSSGDLVAVVVSGASLDKGVKGHLTRMAPEMGYYGASGIGTLPDSGSRSYYSGDPYLICFIDPN